MLKKRIIPVLLWDGIQCVKPVSFQRPYRKLGSMEQYIQVMERRNIDELIIIDIEATPNKRPPNYVKLRQFANNLYCPLTYGGGISSLDDISAALNNGADKVAIKTNNIIIADAARKFGKQAIVGVIDIAPEDAPHHVAEYAMVLEQDGAGELLLTHQKRDGTMRGYHNRYIKYISKLVNIPVIACGGCSSPNDMAQALDAGASAVAAGSMFLYTETTPRSCAKYLQEKGYDVRV